VPDNRAAVRAAARAVKKTWADLQRRGVITLRDDQLRVKALFATADGALLSLRGGVPFVNGVQRGRVEQWSAPWTRPEPVFDMQLDQAHNLSADSSRRWLATGHSSGEWVARVWDRSSRALVLEIQHTQMVSWTGFTADGALVVTLGPELIVTDVATGTRIGEYSLGPVSCSAALIDDSRGLVAVTSPNYRGLAVFGLPQATPIRELNSKSQKNCGEHVFAMGLDVPGDRLVVATGEGLRVYAWTEVLAGSLIALNPVHAFAMRYVYAIVLDAARGRVFFGGIDGTLAALDLGTGAVRTLLTLPGEATIYQLALSPGSNALAMKAGSRPSEDRKPWSALVVIDLERFD
jgi:hypothetical protein